MPDGDLIFEVARVQGKGPFARWAARCFVKGQRWTNGKFQVGRYIGPNGDFMGEWDMTAYGCTDTHAIEQFKSKFAPEIEKERNRAMSFNWTAAATPENEQEG